MSTHRNVRFTGNVFSNQRFGGVSRYVVELASNLERVSDWSASISAPLHINEYLRERGRLGRHRGIYLAHRPPALAAINRFIEGWIRLRGSEGATVTHEILYGFQNLKSFKGLKIATFYDMIHERFMPNEFVHRKKRMTIDASDHLVAISEATKCDMVHFLDVDPDRIDVIYLASSMQPNGAPVEGIPAGNYLLWVGSRRGYKNFECFSKALANSRLWKGGFRLVCAGGPPPTPEERAAWERIGLAAARVTHLQPNEQQLASLYSHAALLVYASKFEGFGIPPLEAMNCGCPVAASSAGSIPEVVGDAACLFDPDDPNEMTHVMDKICESPSYRSELVTRGQLRASRFSWARCASETLSMYRRLIGN